MLRFMGSQRHDRATEQQQESKTPPVESTHVRACLPQGECCGRRLKASWGSGQTFRDSRSTSHSLHGACPALLLQHCFPPDRSASAEDSGQMRRKVTSSGPYTCPPPLPIWSSDGHSAEKPQLTPDSGSSPSIPSPPPSKAVDASTPQGKKKCIPTLDPAIPSKPLGT